MTSECTDIEPAIVAVLDRRRQRKAAGTDHPRGGDNLLEIGVGHDDTVVLAPPPIDCTRLPFAVPRE